MTAESAAQRYRFRVGVFRRRGYVQAKAEALAQRLAKRDADLDDRRVCMECMELRQDGYCSAAARGVIPNTVRRFEPVRDLLQRCEGFKEVAR